MARRRADCRLIILGIGFDGNSGLLRLCCECTAITMGACSFAALSKKLLFDRILDGNSRRLDVATFLACCYEGGRKRQLDELATGENDWVW